MRTIVSNPAFSPYYLLEALRGEADISADRSVTVLEANVYVAEKVKAWAFANRRQTDSSIIRQSNRGDCAYTGNTYTQRLTARRSCGLHFGVSPVSTGAQTENHGYHSRIPPARTAYSFPGGETEIIRQLIERDFPVVDQHQIQEIRYMDEAKRADSR